MRFRTAKTTTIGLLLGVGLMALAGCGGAGRTVKGQIQAAGQKYSVAERDQCSIQLVKEGEAKPEAFTGKVEPDGSFKFPQPIPDGKYKVLVTHTGDYTEFMKLKPGAKRSAGPPDKLKGAFGDIKSPLKVDIDGSASLIVDVRSKTVVKK